MIKCILLLFSTLLIFHCDNVKQNPVSQNNLIELESVWQYLKAYSIHQDECVTGSSSQCQKRLGDNPFLYNSPEEMMKSMYDTLKGNDYTKYDPTSNTGSTALVKGTEVENRMVNFYKITASTALFRIAMFETDVTYRQFCEELPKLTSSNKNCIIDICGNGGGDLEELDSILELFLPESTAYLLVRSREFDPQTHQYHTVDFRPIKTTRPASPYLIGKKIVVLMNRGSASASEILAAGLKDGYGAILAGDTSYGKAIGQIMLRRWGRRALQITCMQMKGISAGDYQNIGLKPDVYINTDIYTNRLSLLAVVNLVEPTATLTDLHLSAILQKIVSPIEPQGYIIRDAE